MCALGGISGGREAISGVGRGETIFKANLSGLQAAMQGRVSFRNCEIIDATGGRAAGPASASGGGHGLRYAGAHEEAVFPRFETVAEGKFVGSEAYVFGMERDL